VTPEVTPPIGGDFINGPLIPNELGLISNNWEIRIYAFLEAIGWTSTEFGADQELAGTFVAPFTNSASAAPR
jgi:hypothetical protein